MRFAGLAAAYMPGSFPDLGQGDPQGNGKALEGGHPGLGLAGLQPGQGRLLHACSLRDFLLCQPEVLAPGPRERDVVQDMGFDHGLRDAIPGRGLFQQGADPPPVGDGHQDEGRATLVAIKSM